MCRLSSVPHVAKANAVGHGRRRGGRRDVREAGHVRERGAPLVRERGAPLVRREHPAQILVR
eukprot:11747-Prymnesium_polylepis.1